ncbi:type IV secretory system conjugative DNA transfer family protein [Pannonibacter phragmitetus]|uniref:TraD/TraG TraM recognition site domain-containing protein n=1 Tax=Pannonibacter phragmitetus TaxID=121719 RepID=A0A0U3PIB0_9HYPH|nr:type IV secretory system conjugative DNA transfer family protein [Pannonibacter phragmitetus]ALV27372.1 hypothetical protein APZ00_10155 [Pannonibacter phragmitetus]
MVFGKLFGGGKGKNGPVRWTSASFQDAWFRSLDPEWREVCRIIANDPNMEHQFKVALFDDLKSGDLDKFRTQLRATLPMLHPENQAKLKAINTSGTWATLDQLETRRFIPEKGEPWPEDALDLAKFALPYVDEDGGRRTLFYPLHFHGEGHLLTIAPTGAGKGQRFILPTLLKFEGPVVVLDPKGENYEQTAWWRSLFGQVFKFAPGQPDSDCYNPLDRVKSWDDARLVADLLIVPQSRDPFWDDSAKVLLSGLIYYVVSTRPPERRNMAEVQGLLAASKEEHDRMLEELKGSDDRRLRQAGNLIETQTDGLRTSITTTLHTQLEVWSSDKVSAITSTTTPGFTMEDILVTANDYAVASAKAGKWFGWQDKGDGQIERAASASVYLIVPPEEMKATITVLRVLLGQLLSEAIRVRKEITDRNAADKELNPRFMNYPIMFYLDEMPQLGYMGIIENAVAITRSYKIRMWLFTQDIAQLKEVYPKWESLVANCRCQIYFRPNDANTADHVAKRLGRKRDIWGNEDWVASPQQLMGTEFWDDCVIFQDGLSIRARMHTPLHEDPDHKEWAEENQAKYGKEPLRAPRAAPPAPPKEGSTGPTDNPPPPAPPDRAGQSSSGVQGETADLEDDPEYQAELAALQARMRARKESKASWEDDAGPPERPAGSSEPPRRPPTPPSFDE